MNILYINSSVRSDSRTALLAEYLLSKLKGSITEIKPHEMSLPSVDEQFICKRNAEFDSDEHQPKTQIYNEADSVSKDSTINQTKTPADNQQNGQKQQKTI